MHEGFIGKELIVWIGKSATMYNSIGVALSARKGNCFLFPTHQSSSLELIFISYDILSFIV